MEIPPSPKVWRQLERKLDVHRRRGRRNLHRLTAMAAAFLLLVIFILLFTMVIGTMRTDRLAHGEAAPVQLEDLATADIDLEAYRVVAITHRLKDRMAAPIAEGRSDRRPVPAIGADEQVERGDFPLAQEVAQLSDFDWLLGQWQGEMEGKRSLESWQRVDARNLRGVGLVVHRRDTLFRETISLEDDGEELVLWVQLAERGRAYPFALRSLQGDKAVFVNADRNFPQEVYLERTAADQYAITYGGGQVSELNAEQSAFLKHRNTISSKEVRRTLRR